MYLQVALYCRNDLNLRSPTNLLLAFASLYKPCRPYLPRYFSACINIPSDWISVADFVQTFSDEISEANIYTSARNNRADKNRNNLDISNATEKIDHNSSQLETLSTIGSLPAILRKVMAAKFSDFDEYQLAKYNKQKKAKKASKDKVYLRITDYTLSNSR